MPDAPVIFYLHGFASSAKSTKAAYLGERLAEHGLTLRCPDFNQPDFATLTVTRMLQQLEAEIANPPSLEDSASFGGPGADEAVTLIGSSLGGTLAILAAASLGARVDRLVLLAPAVMLDLVGSGWLPADRVAEWRRLGRLPFFHYADNIERMLNFTFYEDSFRYNPCDARFSQPTLIFQGRHDSSVDPRAVEAFARHRRNVTLEVLEDDHQLGKSLPRIWEGIRAFLEIR